MISKKYSLILAAFVCIVLLSTGTALAATYSGGSGTIDDPYNLSTDSDIDTLSATSADWGMNFTLTNNITLEDNHTSIAPGAGFTGDFDGNGYIIKNLTIYSESAYTGFFGYTTSTANIHDLGIKTSLDGVYSIADTAGILVGRNDGIISNCSATGNVTGNDYIGGLVGNNYGTVSNNYVTGNITGNNYIGGLVGNNDDTVINCYATGNVTGNNYIGGLVGDNSGGTLSISYATSNVSGSHFVGGFVGYKYTGYVIKCYATGAVSGDDHVGGFIGYNYGGVSTCYYSGSTGDDYATETSEDNFTDYNFISGASGLNWNSVSNLITTEEDPDYVWRIIDGYTLPFFQYQEIDIDVLYSGGLGTTEHPYLLSTDADIDELSATPENWSMNFTLTNNITLVGNHTRIGNDVTKFTGDFNGNGYVIKNLTIYTEDFDTGFFGHTAASTNIHDLGIETSSEGVYSTNNRVGGLVGYNYGTVSNCSVTGNVTGNDYVGCLIGRNYDGTIINSSSSGNVTSSAGDVGGLIGYNFGIIDNCSSSSTIFVKNSANYNIGGLIGYNSNNISNSYATGDVTGDNYNYAGGLIGENEAGTITNCYATGDVSGANKIGGLIGENYKTCTVTNSYATGNVNNSGQYTGGLIGNLDGISSINNCSATGNVTGSSATGGLIGATYLTKSTQYGIINNCYVTGTISGAYGTGGLIGMTSGDTVVTNSYATGNVENIDDAVGGLIGENLGSVSNCFAAGTVTTTSINGFIGSLFGSNGGDANNCYYSNSQGDDYGTYTSYANFTKLAFISGSSTLNWNENITTADDSSYIWKIIDGYTFPYFQWQDAPDTLAPYVESLSPSNGNNNTDSSTVFWINITGACFNLTDPAVSLTMDGQDTITGTNVSKTHTTINATFDISSAIEGDWSLYVTNPDGQTSTAKTFTVDSLPVLSTPVLSNTTGNDYVNWSWEAIESADSYNVSLNGAWTNGTTITEINDSNMDSHATSEITVLAYNETYGVLSDSIVDSVTLANNPVSITNLNDISIDESELIEIDANFDDLDEDAVTFNCNRTDLFSNFNTTTGEGSWQTNYTDSGTYFVDFNVSDGHGSTDSQVVTITVTNIPTTMYVGSSGHDYTTIQDAINDATDGDTIIVNDGTYNENVDVDKSVILRSENGSTKTAVTAKYSETSVFYISTDNVTINGFNVTGTTSITAGIYLYSSNNHTITNNDVSGNYYGIVLGSSQNNKLTNNKVNSNDMYGIALGGSNNNTLINNNISNTSNNHGIYLLGSDYNILTSNTVCDNNGHGVYIEDASNNTLSGNTVKGNTESGIYLSGSNNTIITDNILNENEENGIYLDGFSTNNTLENNVANSNFYYGIWLISSDNVLTSNTATNNSLYDIVIDDPNEINNLKVTDNGARVSFLSDGIQTGIKGNVTNSTSLSGKTNVNGYLTVKRGGVVVKSADVGVTREDPTLDITISYDDSGMSSSDESSIDLYKYKNSTWVAVSGTSLDTSSNQVTATLSEGTFGLFKDPETSSSSSSGSDSGSVATRVRSQGTIATLPTNGNGEVTGDTVVKSKDTITTLTLYKGTVGTDTSGNPVNKIIVTTPASMPADTPKEVLESGLYYDFGPSGTTFSQDVLITIDFDPEEYEGKSPVIYTYSEENGWVALETTVDWENGRATAYTNHFSLYALFGDEEQEIVEETSEVTAEFSESVEENTETPTEDEGGFGYIYLILGIVVITVVGYIVVKNQKGEGGL